MGAIITNIQFFNLGLPQTVDAMKESIKVDNTNYQNIKKSQKDFRQRSVNFGWYIPVRVHSWRCIKEDVLSPLFKRADDADHVAQGILPLIKEFFFRLACLVVRLVAFLPRAAYVFRQKENHSVYQLLQANGATPEQLQSDYTKISAICGDTIEEMYVLLHDIPSNGQKNLPSFSLVNTVKIENVSAHQCGDSCPRDDHVCPPCREEGAEKELQCGHLVHQLCLQEWVIACRTPNLFNDPDSGNKPMKENPDCPMCHSDIMLSEEAALNNVGKDPVGSH
ncbi:MAG: hypothetical protein WB791_02350 [Waddliaceae bacterium]